MHHALDGLPQCKHCLWQFSSWHWFLQHFAHDRCPALRASLPTSAEPCEPSTAVPAATEKAEPEEADLSDAAPLQLPSTVQQEHPLQQFDKDLISLACDSDWRPLAQYFRRSDQHHCPFCNQWLARPTYLSRHLNKQHGSIFQFHERVQQWLKERSTALGHPCSFCHQAYKASHTSRLRHALACSTLYRTGLFHALAKTLPQALGNAHVRPEPHGDATEGACERGGASRPDAGHASECPLASPGSNGQISGNGDSSLRTEALPSINKTCFSPAHCTSLSNPSFVSRRESNLLHGCCTYNLSS